MDQERDPSADEPLERSRRRADRLGERVARAAADVADSEEKVADTLEESARLRPHAAERLEQAARDARSFAAYERDQSRRRAPGARDDRDREAGPGS